MNADVNADNVAPEMWFLFSVFLESQDAEDCSVHFTDIWGSYHGRCGQQQLFL